MLRGGSDPDMPLAYALELNAFTLDYPDGPRLTAVWTWAPELVPEHAAQELAKAWFEALEAIVVMSAQAGAARLTPADVALADITQQEIEQLESNFAGN